MPLLPDPELQAEIKNVLEVRNTQYVVVVVCGGIMTMLGLPRVPAANSILLNDDGMIEGLF